MAFARKLIKPATLTECVFENTAQGRAKHAFWKVGLNPMRSLRGAQAAYPAPIREKADRLAREGLILDDASSFLSSGGLEALAKSREMILARCESDEVRQIVERGRNDANGKDYLVQIVPFAEPHGPDSPLLKLALDENLLQTIGAYFGMWPQLHAIASWLNFENKSDAKLSQLWHRDPEDLKIVKVFIYLEPVTSQQGPFSYIFKTQPFGAASSVEPAHEHPRRVTDAEMETVFPRDKWFECVGPANTMVLADTVGYHRGGNVKSGRRLLITFTYTSGQPQEKRHLQLTAKPDWIKSPIQEYAL
jgi:hypothetical protein